MASSTQQLTYTGSNGTISLSIDYLDRSEISVYYDAVLSTDWEWTATTGSIIQLIAPLPAVGTEVLIKRTTDITELRHQFSLGAAFTEATLDEDLLQILHIAQEAQEANLSGEFYGNIDMHGYKITNLGTATDPTDAVSLGQYQADALGASTSAATATAAADLAVPAAATATAAATSAEDSLTSFLTYYIGAAASDPTVDGNGDPLTDGAIYFRTAAPRIWRVYSTVTGWQDAPKGVQGDTGATGATGPTGPANTLSVGTVTTGAAGSSASVSITGTAPAQTVSFTIPRGDTGAQGPEGPVGPAGPSGAGTGDVIGPGTITANTLVQFNGTTGTSIKASTLTGVLKATSGVPAAATAGTDYVIPSGNVATATALATARSINGVSFNGTADITIADSTRVLKAGDTMTGNLLVPKLITGPLTGFISAETFLASSTAAGSITAIGRFMNTGTTASTGTGIVLGTYTNSSAAVALFSINAVASDATGTGYADFNTAISGTAASRMRISPLGNLLVGTTSDSATYKARVNGSALITGGLDVAPTGDTGDVGVQIGVGRTGDGNTFIDLVGDTTYTDYGVRLIRATGSNGNSTLVHRGTGALRLQATDAGTITLAANGTTSLSTAGTTTTASGTWTFASTVAADISGNAASSTYATAVPVSSTSGTLVAADAGKAVVVTASITAPNAIFSAGQAVTIVNNSASAITITQGTSVTLRLAGSTSTGSRTLAAYGIATLWWQTSAVAFCTGVGLT
jgi:hypothetical protein